MKKMTDKQVGEWWTEVEEAQKKLNMAIKYHNVTEMYEATDSLDVLRRKMQRHQAALVIERGQVSGHEYES